MVDVNKPFFSIVVSYRRDAVSDKRFVKCLESIAGQDCQDFELLLYHDGELPSPLCEEAEKIIIGEGYELLITDKWFKDWGHSLRDLGLRNAKGRYIILLNGDNLLYNSLGRMKEYIESTGLKPFYTFPVKMIGVKELSKNNNSTTIIRTGNKRDSVHLVGIPKPGSIDVLQGVATLEAWKSINYWYRKDINSDGFLYEELAIIHGYVNNHKIIIGEHW